MSKKNEIDEHLESDERDESKEAEVSQQEARLRDLAHDLKSGIDSKGRFSNNLTAMSRGYAAGADIHELVARRMITKSFQDQYKRSPMEYLTVHRQMMDHYNNNQKREAENDLER